MHIYVRSWSHAAPAAKRPFAVLTVDNWDDHTFKTMFHAALWLPDRSTPLELGAVKILSISQESGRTDLPRDCTALGSDYCSLGQSIEYYETLLDVSRDVRAAYLEAMSDAAADPSIASRFANEPGWRMSLLRFRQAEHALAEGGHLVRGDGQREVGKASFAVQPPVGGSVTFAFDDSGPLPGRTNAIVGYNGVGKTRLLAEVATAASGVSRAYLDVGPRLTGLDTTFGAVVAVSYSAFDDFALPNFKSVLHHPDRDAKVNWKAKTEYGGYVYCGLRRHVDDGTPNELKSQGELDEEFLLALQRASNTRKRAERLRRALSLLESEPSFGRIDVRLIDWVEDAAAAKQGLGKLSSGHKIVLNISVQLAAHLQTRSLVLVDEPESHLHPPLLAALLKAVHQLLQETDSFAIVATHSPVVLQEVPAAFVKVLERHGDVNNVRLPDIETFGENVGLLTSYVFSLDNSQADYQGALQRLADSHDLESIEAYFPRGLSAQARALVLQRLAQRSQ